VALYLFTISLIATYPWPLHLVFTPRTKLKANLVMKNKLMDVFHFLSIRIVSKFFLCAKKNFCSGTIAWVMSIWSWFRVYIKKLYFKKIITALSHVSCLYVLPETPPKCAAAVLLCFPALRNSWFLTQGSLKLGEGVSINQFTSRIAGWLLIQQYVNVQ